MVDAADHGRVEQNPLAGRSGSGRAGTLPPVVRRPSSGFCTSGGPMAEGKRPMGLPIGFFLSLELGLSGISRVTSQSMGGKGGFEVPPVPFLFQE